MPRTTPRPSGAVRCERGDVVARLENPDLARKPDPPVVRLYRVEDVVRLVRLVPFGAETFVDEDDLLDSVPPAYLDQAHVLLRAIGPPFGSFADAAKRATEGMAAVPGPLLCAVLDELEPETTAVWPGGRPTAEREVRPSGPS